VERTSQRCKRNLSGKIFYYPQASLVHGRRRVAWLTREPVELIILGSKALLKVPTAAFSVLIKEGLHELKGHIRSTVKQEFSELKRE